MDAPMIVFIAALVAGGAGVLAGIGGLLLARQQTATEREMRQRLEVLVEQISGGDSYVYLEPLRQGKEIRYFVRQTGRFPTFDVVVRVTDAEGRTLHFGPRPMGTIKRGSGLDWTIPVQEALIDRWPLLFAEPPAPDAPVQEFRAELAARNGIVIQRLRISPAGPRWNTDSRQIERAGVGPLTLPGDFREAQDQP